jgi:DNA (cytosine-5)-methyltransferase 1
MLRGAYYNENDPYAAQWLRNLIAAGHIAPGDVDARSIVDVKGDDLERYEQAHFFAGIGGWSAALRLAGWPDGRPVWTGSCPCQPFSAAGKREGFADKRHLWPAWFSLIRECHPAIVFGEQVEAAIRQGWLDTVFADMEGESYACGAAILPACSVGAPHIRKRLWFVADNGSERWEWRERLSAGSEPNGPDAGRQQSDDGPVRIHETGRELADAAVESDRASTLGNFWHDAEFIPCTDGKARPVEPGTFPLAHGIPGRVGRLRGYGNAIVPQVAAEFVIAFMECQP